MKRARRTISYLALLLIVCLLLPALGVHAAAADPTVSVDVPVSVTGADCTVAVYDAAGDMVTSARLPAGTTRNMVFSVTAPYDTPMDYRLAVTDADANQYRFDRTVYRLTVQLYRFDGRANYVLTARVEGGSSAKPDELTFTNVPPPTPATGNVGVQKKISGKPNKTSDFEFVLERLDDANPMPAGVAGSKAQLTIHGAGMGEFGTITFTEAGVYEYRITENDSNKKNYTCDKSVYTVRFTVTESAGALHAERVFIKKGKPLAAVRAVFTNIYTGTDGTPGTGDGTHLKLWGGLALFSLAGLLLLLIGYFVFRRAAKTPSEKEQ